MARVAVGFRAAVVTMLSRRRGCWLLWSPACPALLLPLRSLGVDGLWLRFPRGLRLVRLSAPFRPFLIGLGSWVARRRSSRLTRPDCFAA